jgi:hypothetical protein
MMACASCGCRSSSTLISAILDRFATDEDMLLPIYESASVPAEYTTTLGVEEAAINFCFRQVIGLFSVSRLGRSR